MSISSIFLITDVKAETLEESFKNTPIPFWNIDNEKVTTSYNPLNQDILFRYGDYFEDFNDISDWDFDVNCDQCTATTDRGILSFKAGNNGNTDWDYYLSDIFDNIGGYLNYEVKVKINTLDGSPFLKIYNEYPANYEDIPIPNEALDNWIIISGTTVEEQITRVALGIISIVGNEDIIIDCDYFLLFNEDNGILDISIPIDQFVNQKFEFMIDTQNLTETTRLDFGIFQNDESMNYDFSLENQTFSQRDFEFDYSGYNYLRFKLDLKYSTNYYKLSCYDENNSKIFDNLIFEYVRKSGNNLKIQSDNFTGWFYLYYFIGDVDYLTTWKETIINQDPNIETYQLSASALGNNMLTEHEINYNRYITNFQFLRTNLVYDT